MNLAVNARDAMPGGGKLTLETANIGLDKAYAGQHLNVIPGPYIMLAVTDTGVGMDAETQSRIFEPFFTTKGLGKGTGLGLSIVYGIVEQSGGHIRVESAPGHGTTFKIYLPQVEPAARLTPPPTISPPAVASDETILLVEDEAGVRLIIRRFLQKRGYRVLEAHHAEEALRLCQQHEGRIDLLITDVVMPDISGPELAGRLTQLYPNLKILYISGYSDDLLDRHKIQILNFLEKPFSSEGLLRKVRDLLDQVGDT
jgi:CheY-like chemotaxis protein